MAAVRCARPYSFGVSNQTAFWQPLTPLTLNGVYQLALTAGITEAGGNPIASQTTSFTVTDFGILQPTNGAAIAEGQLVPVAAGGSNPAGVGAVQFSANGATSAGAFSAPYFSELFPLPRSPSLGTNVLTIGAVAHLHGGECRRGTSRPVPPPC